jgi:hypothetical protein
MLDTLLIISALVILGPDYMEGPTVGHIILGPDRFACHTPGVFYDERPFRPTPNTYRLADGAIWRWLDPYTVEYWNKYKNELVRYNVLSVKQRA